MRFFSLKIDQELLVVNEVDLPSVSPISEQIKNIATFFFSTRFRFSIPLTDTIQAMETLKHINQLLALNI